MFTLREYPDLEKLREKAKDSSKLVVIGASFIGLEAAASLKDALKDKLDVVVCDATEVPYERVLGKEVGQSIQLLHEKNGIKF